MPRSGPRIPPIVQIVLLLLGAGMAFMLVLFLSRSPNRPAAPTPEPTLAAPSPTPVAPTPTPLQAARDDVALVHSRVVLALRRDDAGALFNEYAPGVSGVAGFYGDLVQGMAALAAESGAVSDVLLVRPPVIGAGGDAAEAEVQVVREAGTNGYRTRYKLVDSQWWLEELELLPLVQP